MKYQNDAISHISSSILEKLDNMHFKFLRDIDVHPAEAFLDFNFAPPILRRNIGILGMLHKRVLGLCHPMFQTLLPFCNDVPGCNYQGNHDRSLYGHLYEVKFHLVFLLFDYIIFLLIF